MPDIVKIRAVQGSDTYGDGSTPVMHKLNSVVDILQDPSIDISRNRSNSISKDSVDESAR